MRHQSWLRPNFMWNSPFRSQRTHDRTHWRRRAQNGAIILLALGLLGGAWYRWNQRFPVPDTEIYQGVTYGCNELAPDEDGHGLVHWVKVDLTAPGIELYVTPLDPIAQAQGWQYRLQTTTSVVQRERLAVGMNASLFHSESGWIPLSGDLARSVDTVVSDHEVSHLCEHTYLLWFGDEMTPHLEAVKPPSEEALTDARWGIGGRSVRLRDGRIQLGSDSAPNDARTVVGIDPARKLLFLATFECATPLRALAMLASLGAQDGMLLDGGDSTSMALGKEARGTRSGRLISGWRPAVATHFGVRARPVNAR